MDDVNEIHLLQDGSWENLVSKKDKDKKDAKVENTQPVPQQKKVDIDMTVDLGKDSFCTIFYTC